MSLEETEGTWNLGIGMVAIVAAHAVDGIIEKLATDGIPAWVVGAVSTGQRASTGSASGWEQGAKGVNGGAVRLISRYAD
jgi:phosphoribosylformylglycinamidine cyclo-ligase